MWICRPLEPVDVRVAEQHASCHIYVSVGTQRPHIYSELPKLYFKPISFAFSVSVYLCPFRFVFVFYFFWSLEDRVCKCLFHLSLLAFVLKADISFFFLVFCFGNALWS